MKKKIPKFKNEAEERFFWQMHDSADYLDWSDAKETILPKLKPSILSPADAFKKISITAETRRRLHLAYSKDYRIENDLNIVWKCLKMLGN